MDILLDNIINQIKSVNPYDVLSKVIIDHKPILIKLNKEQLDKGIKSTGDRLSPYSPKYAKWRRKKGLQTLNKDLKVTSKFRDEIYALPGLMFTEVGSTDDKEKWLVKMEGVDIFGLTPYNLERFLYGYGVAEAFYNEYIRRISL